MGLGVQQKARIAATFSYNEDLIFSSDENAMAAVIWDSRTGELMQRLTGHNNVVRSVFVNFRFVLCANLHFRYVATSPTDTSIVTCSDDHRARFWDDDNVKK